ncbi:hypothetical protein DFH06DRAFT_1346967 [Mycena polygramma]|nr:hypothetical protein DFH06DRAFT_1346967 [Mycena polygramma]
MSHGTAAVRDSPPHLPVPVSQPAGPLAAVAEGDSAFVTAPHSAARPEDAESYSSGERSAQPGAPSGLQVRVFVDDNGVQYVVNPDTGLRFDISPDGPGGALTGAYRHPNARPASLGAPSEPTPSSVSDLRFSSSPGSTLLPPIGSTPQPVEEILDDLFTGVEMNLTPEQKDKYASIRAMLTTGRDALLSTSALVAGQCLEVDDTARDLENVRQDTEAKLQALHQRVVVQETQLGQTLGDNLRILRAFGSTENQLAQLTRSMTAFNNRSSPLPQLAPLPRPDSRSVTPLDEFQGKADAVLPPRGANESPDAFYGRGTRLVSRKERTAAAFSPEDGRGYHPAPSASAAHFAKTARFEDPGSISTAIRKPFPNYTGSGLKPGAGNVSAVTIGHDSDSPATNFEVFHQDQERLVRRIAHREIGEALNLPPHIRSVKTDPPTKYKGEDDLDIFMKFVELHCTWLRSQMLCGYDTSVDKYRTSILKSHLEGPALEWFILTISNPHFAPERELTFTETLCALLQRFVTSANAQRATHAFDLVRFDNAAGPDEFAEQLLKRANLMRHVPDEFAINQRFLAGLPQAIRYKMKVDKEMTAEYTPFSSLHHTARHLWRSMHEDSQSSTGNTRANLAPRAPAAAPVATTRRAAPTAHAAQPTPNLAIRPVNTEDKRTCYKCGVVGHIGSDPKCPKYHEHSPHPGARVGAQRVHESYSDGGIPPHDEFLEPQSADEDNDDEYDGLWGGGQYEPDEEDPNTAPDLAELTALDDNEPVRVGAIRARYYSMRVPTPQDEQLEASGGTESSVIPSPGDVDDSAAILDLETLELRLPSNGVYHEWSAAEEARQVQTQNERLRADPLYPGLLAGFEARVGNASLTASQTLELESIAAIGTEEAARDTWRSFIPEQPAMPLGYSASALRTTAVNVENQATRFSNAQDAMRQYQQTLMDLLARRLEQMDEIRRLGALPTTASSGASANITTANNLNVRLCYDLDNHIVHVDRLLRRLTESLNTINEELTRRMLAREAYILERSQAAASSSSLRPQSSPSVAAGEDEVTPANAPVVASTPVTPPPALGSTPPPSYPGTPESGGTEGLWDAMSDHDASVNSVIVLPGDLPIDISDSEDETPLSLQASRIMSPSPTPAEDLANTDPLVFDTYDEVMPIADLCDGGDSPPEVSSTPPLIVLDTYDAVAPTEDQHDRDPILGEAPRMISRAIYRLGDICAEYVTTYLRHDASVFVEYSPLPELHYLNERFRDLHQGAMDIAIRERALELGVTRETVRQTVTLDTRCEHPADDGQTRARHGFLDTEPALLPGTNFHERIASLGPEDDD